MDFNIFNNKNFKNNFGCFQNFKCVRIVISNKLIQN